MKVGKRKHGFIKDEITGYVDTTGGNIEALDTLMLCTITKKNTLLGTEHEFTSVVGVKIRPTSTTKNTKGVIIWASMKKPLHGCFIVDNTAGKHINEMDIGEKRLIPKLEGHRGASKQGKAYFNNMPMLTFSRTVLLVCVWA